ncbi:MAG: UDP-2,3-diacylglucosamine diphosphatase [Saprospiraceae bacterium]|nr:UDP-2,3-diacylglucosamine diphosphatase [Saprospiraceae bacterium]
MSKFYFASDFHLGIDARVSSREREKQIVRWLDSIQDDALEIFLVGDVFDFWFEYRSVVPKGHSRLLGKLAQIRDKGIPIQFFTGNHDMWMFSYFEEELGIAIHRQPVMRVLAGKKFFIGHGDGLGPNDGGYKFIKRVFSSPVSQWLFARLHPNLTFSLARFWSSKSRETAAAKNEFLGKDNEWLVQYANHKLHELDVDYFVFGHRHLPINCLLDNGISRYFNLGDWLHYNSFGVFDGSEMHLDFFENKEGYAVEL